nr:FUSC family protein [uncultured Tolumonas sp.]
MSIFASASPFEIFIYRHIRIIHVIKICLALLIAHLINAAFPVPHFAWTSVTIVIIMLTLPQVGGALEKSIQRIIGTVLGACYAIAILLLTSNTWLIAILTMLGIAGTAYRATSKMGYAYLVAGFTLIMVLDGGSQSFEEALWRTGTILLGCVIALLVSLIVLPLRARNEWRWQLAESLKRMGKIWQAHLSPNVVKPLATRAMLKSVERAIQRQKALHKSVVLESKVLRHHSDVLDELVAAQSRCLLLLELLAQTRWESSRSALIIQDLFSLGFAGRELGLDLQALSQFCAGHSDLLPPSRQELLVSYKREIQITLTEQSSFYLNANGYAWLVYQAGIQMEHINSLIRRITMVTDLEHA